MDDKELFSNLLEAYHDYEDAIMVDEETGEPEDMDAAMEAADQAEAGLKKAFDAYILDLLKRRAKG